MGQWLKSLAVLALLWIGIVCLWVIHWMPFSWIAVIGQVVGKCLYALPLRRRRIAERNLELCFPNEPLAIRQQWVKLHFIAYARALFEYGVLLWGSADRIRSMVQIEGLEHFLNAQQRGPVILFAPHFVGLNAGGIRLSLEYKGASMYARQSHPLLDKLIRKARERFGHTHLVLRTEGIRGLIRSLKSGLPVYFLPDMDLGSKGALFIPFFGVQAATVPALSRLVKMTGASIVPCITWQEEKNTNDNSRKNFSSLYRIEFFPTWDKWTGENTEQETQDMHAFLEEQIRHAPWQYLWTHKRFKTRPLGEKSLYDIN